MTNLYRVVDTKTKKVIEEGFTSREDAKVVRNKHNEEAGDKTEGDGQPRFVISRGKDHPNGSTDGFDHTKKKKQWY